MVTAKGRLDHVKRSLKCYLDQSYPNKELVIVNEGPPEYQSDIDSLVQGRSDVRTVWLSGEYTLGALRNIAVALSEGELICQWDDDDFCTPQRLSSQYSFMQSHPQCKVCYLSDQLHYYFNDRCLYWDNWKAYASNGIKRCALIPGTLMAYKHLWNDWQVRYPSGGKYAKAGEDTYLADSFLARSEEAVMLLSGKGYMHVYSHHGTNQVFDLKHHRAISDMRSQKREVVIEHKSQIISSLNYYNFGKVKVMCRDGLVFTHGGGDNA